MANIIDSVDGLLIYASSSIKQDSQLLYVERMKRLNKMAQEEEKKRHELILKRTFNESEFKFSTFGISNIKNVPIALQFHTKRPIEELFKIKGYASLEREFIRDFNITKEEKKSKESNEKLLNFSEFIDQKSPVFNILSNQKLREIIIDPKSYFEGNSISILTNNEIKERAKLLAGISKYTLSQTEDKSRTLDNSTKTDEGLRKSQVDEELGSLLDTIYSSLDSKIASEFNSGNEQESIKLKKVKDELDEMKKDVADKETFYKTLKLFALSNNLA